MFDAYGSDAMRWMLMSSPVLRGGDMAVTEAAIRDAVRQVLLPLWNVWYFFSLYANAEAYAGDAGAPTRTHLLDRYVLAKTGELVADGHARSWTRTTSPAPARTVRSYLDALTNWYVRRSRDRFWAGDRGRVRHALHGAGDAVPGGGAARAADRRGDLARPDRRAVGAPDRLAGGRPSSRPTTTLVAAMDAVRDVCLGGAVAAQGAGAAGAAAAGDADRGHAGGGGAARRSPTWSPTRSTSRRSCSPTTWPRTASRC